MRPEMKVLLMVIVLLGMGQTGWCAEEVLIVEQEYNIFEHGKDGPNARNIRQRLYLADDWVRIDEFAGQGKNPTETFLIDFNKEEIINLDNENLTQKVETFAERRERIDRRKEGILGDLKKMPDGPQKDKTESLYRGLLDDKRSFKLLQEEKDLKPRDAGELKKDICGVRCDLVWIIDNKEDDYVPLKAWLHPEWKVAYDSAEVLYLLQLIGSKLAKYLQKNKDLFQRLPMEMHIQLAAGGRLDTKVLSVEKKKRSELDPNLQVVPADYKEHRRRGPPPAAPADVVEPGE